MSSPRPAWLAWVCGIGTAIAVHTFLSIAAFGLNLPVWIDYGRDIVIDHGRWEEERNGHSTALGWWILTVAIIVGARFGMAVSSSRINGGVSPNGNGQTLIVLAAVSIYAFTMTVIWEAFGDSLNWLPGVIAFLIDGTVLSAVVLGARAMSIRKGVLW